MNRVWKYSQAQGRARLVLLAIADHQGEIGAWPSIETLAKMVNASERSVQRDIQELIAMGELTVEVRNAPTRGQYKANLYWVNVSEVTTETSEVTDRTPEVTDEASEVTAGGVITLNRTITEPLEINYVQNDYEEDFLQFWKIYPRSEGKAKAARAFRKALKIASFDTILAGVTRLANDPNKPSLTYIPHAATWLNDERWNDAPYPVRGNAKLQNQHAAMQGFLNSFKEPENDLIEIDWSLN